MSDKEGLGAKLDKSDKDAINTALKETEAWLEENGESATAEDVEEQLSELQATLAPITSKVYADGAGAGGSGSGSAPITSHAPAAPAPARPKVQQLRPTNKGVAAAPGAASAEAGPSVVPRAAGPRIVNAAAAAAPPQQPGATSSVPRAGPRVVTGQGAGNNVLVNACQVRRVVRERGTAARERWRRTRRGI